MRIGQHEDILTCSPLSVRKLVQPWKYLGVARSGSEPRYLPSESYLGQKEIDDDDEYYYDELNTCPPSHANHCRLYLPTAHLYPQLLGIQSCRRLHRF